MSAATECVEAIRGIDIGADDRVVGGDSSYWFSLQERAAAALTVDCGQRREVPPVEDGRVVDDVNVESVECPTDPTRSAL